jgi:tetratricopeptide (TPR) repeat protein
MSIMLLFDSLSFFENNMGNCLAKDKLHASENTVLPNLKPQEDQAVSSKSTADATGDNDSQRTTDKEKKDCRSDLSPEARVFLDTFDSYMYCRKKLNAKYSEVQELQLIAKDPMESHMGDKSKCQQQSCAGTPVRTLGDLYIAAEIAKKVFKNTVKRVVTQVSEICGARSSNIKVKFASLKERERAHAKAEEDYENQRPGPAISWLKDIVRASVVFNSSDQILQCIDLLQVDPSIHIIKVKNRFQKPTLTGYRDVLLHFRIDTGIGFQHICELQIHHAAMDDVGSGLNSNHYYEYFRSFFTTTDTTKPVADLTLISRGVTEGGDSFLTELLDKKIVVEQLTGLAKLFEDRLMEYSWALRVYEKLLQIHIVNFGRQCVNIIDTLNNMGRILYKQGKLEAASERFSEALETNELADTSFDPFLGDTYNGLANVLMAQGKVDESLGMYSKSLDIKKKMLGEQQLSVATIYGNMAIGNRHQDRLDEAMELYQKCLGIYMRILGDEHSNVADIYSNIAGILSIQRKLDESLKMYQKSIEIYKKTFGDDHEFIAEAYQNMANVLQRQNRHEGSRDMYHRALHIRIKVLGEWHSKVASSYHDMAMVYYGHGKLDEAIAMHNKVLEIKQKTLGEEHMSVGDVYFNIGGILFRQKLFDDALKALERAQCIYNKSRGNDHGKAAQINQIMEIILKKKTGQDLTLRSL